MKPESKVIGVEKELVKRLRKMFDNDDFVFGVRAYLDTDEERQWVIEGIDEGELQNVRDVLDYIEQIDDDREGGGDD